MAKMKRGKLQEHCSRKTSRKTVQQNSDRSITPKTMRRKKKKFWMKSTKMKKNQVRLIVIKKISPTDFAIE